MAEIAETTGKVIKVLIGQVDLTRPPNRLQAVLGSCIALVIYDPTEKLAGMAHILLPNSQGRPTSALPGKYADQAVRCLLDGLDKYGGKRVRYRAKMAGGAHMFAKSLQKKDGDVGGLNVAAVQSALADAGITVLAKDVGGAQGRKVEFSAQTAEFVVEDFAARRQIL